MNKKKVLRAVNICSSVFFVCYYVTRKFFVDNTFMLWTALILLFVSGLVGLTLTIVWKQKLLSIDSVGYIFWTLFGGLVLLFGY